MKSTTFARFHYNRFIIRSQSLTLFESTNRKHSTWSNPYSYLGFFPQLNSHEIEPHIFLGGLDLCKGLMRSFAINRTQQDAAKSTKALSKIRSAHSFRETPQIREWNGYGSWFLWNCKHITAATSDMTRIRYEVGWNINWEACNCATIVAFSVSTW